MVKIESEPDEKIGLKSLELNNFNKLDNLNEILRVGLPDKKNDNFSIEYPKIEL